MKQDKGLREEITKIEKERATYPIAHPIYEVVDEILSKILEAVDGARLKPEEYNKIINKWKKRPLDNEVTGRDKLVEILIEAQLQAIKKLFEGEK